MTAVASRDELQRTAGPRGMKWWGWGLEGVSFSHEDKPELGPFIERALGLDVTRPTSRPVPFEALAIPEPALAADLRAALEAAAGAVHVSIEPHDRVVHARG